MKTTLFMILSVFVASAAKSEVFKCQSSTGKTVYQEKPCPPSTSQGIITIETMDPAKNAEAEKKLAEWKADFEAREAAENKAKKERRMELEQLAEIEALNRNANAQKQLSETVVQAIRNNQSITTYAPYIPYMPYNNHWPFRYVRPLRPDHDDQHHNNPPKHKEALSKISR